MSVIVARALPDARDGLKPVHRRILYSMYEQGHTPDKKYVKSARVVGDVIGKYHPHGDQSIYDAMVRMAQDFSMRVPLIDGQGNFGSVDGDPPAAYRYTEARLTQSALDVLGDIDKDTVDFQPNYDNSEKRTVGSAGQVPEPAGQRRRRHRRRHGDQHPAAQSRRSHRRLRGADRQSRAGIDELINIIPGPDFPTGGIILGRQGIRAAYHLGRGSIVMRGKVTIDTIRKDREAIIITEIPYQVNKATMVERDRRTGAREEDRGHRRSARRIRPRRLSRRRRTEARCDGRRGAEPALSLHAAADEFPAPTCWRWIPAGRRR